MTLTFRGKVLLALMLVIAAVTAATLLATQRSVEATYQRLFVERFQREGRLLGVLQDARLAAVKARCLELARSVRLLAAMAEKDTELLYRIALDELRDVLAPPAEDARHAIFFRLLDADGRVLAPGDARAGLTDGHGRWEGELGAAGRALSGTQAVGWLVPEVEDHEEVAEVVLTPIVDPVERRAVGALVLGFPARDVVGAGPGAAEGGLLVEGRLYAPGIPEPAQPVVRAAAVSALEGGAADDPPSVVVGGVPHRVLVRRLATAAGFPPAAHVGLYSTTEVLAAERALRTRVLGAAAGAMLIGLALSLVISRGLTGPIAALVRGAHEIERGRLDVTVPVQSHDEIGRLAEAFNEMVQGLALKERYRSLLNVVADREIADALLRGEVSLAGELRDASVLFCDVCGFTALTEHMAPADVIGLVNAHMTALTRVVYAHGGVVDKFAGDALMALFGAPRSAGDDAARAVRAAADMIAERARLNVGAPHPLEVRIGIASGPVVAGCTGSADRLSYTVLGARVNLAARLCTEAGRMEILIDEGTRQAAGDAIAVEARPGLALKGFSAPITGYRVVAGARRASVS